MHQHAATLALRLGRMGGRLKEAAATVACEVGNKFIGAQTLSSMGAAEVAQMLFYFPNCIELRAAITSRASELSTASLAAVLGAILPIAVRQCLKVFQGWLRSTVRACFWTITKLSNSKDHVVRVFSLAERRNCKATSCVRQLQQMTHIYFKLSLNRQEPRPRMPTFDHWLRHEPGSCAIRDPPTSSRRQTCLGIHR